MYKITILVAIASLMSLSACQGELDFKKTKGGMPYKIYEKNKKGKKLEYLNIVKAHVIRQVKDSVAYDSHESFPYYFSLDTVTKPYDQSEVLKTLKVGDSVIMVQLADTLMKRIPNFSTRFKKGDKFTVTYTILDVFTNEDSAIADFERERDLFIAREGKVIEDYLKKNNLTASKVGRGVYVNVTEEGTGPMIDSGNFVSLLYKGTSFSGKQFDTNINNPQNPDPLSFTVDVDQMMPGFHDGVKAFRKGGRGIVYIPSMLGYAGNSPTPDIKPFEHVFFEIEILDVKKERPSRGEMMMPPVQDTSHQGHGH